jgi:hypothetical protein
MLSTPIQQELMRLQMHPVNLAVQACEGRTVTLRGSLLHYWKVAPCIDGQLLLEVLQALPDAAGPTLVMNAISAHQVSAAP